MRYGVVIEKAKRNYSAYVPDLPGCAVTARTMKGISREIRKAVRFHIQGLKREGHPVPRARTVFDHVDA